MQDNPAVITIFPCMPPILPCLVLLFLELYFLAEFFLDLEKLNQFSKVEIFLEQKEVAFLSHSKICENLNFSTVHPEQFKFFQIFLSDKNATYSG